MKSFCLINETGDASITHDLVVSMASALAKQQLRFASFWQRTPLSVSMADSEAAAPSDPEMTLAKLVMQLDDAQALAYHTVTTDGRPLILIGWGAVKANGGTLAGADSLLTATSHELCEAAADPFCSLWWDLNGTTQIPFEACDPTQGDAYEEDSGSGLFVSNFVGPRYFSTMATGPFDAMGVVTAAGQLRRGGYQTQRTTATGATQNVFGALPEDGGMPEWKRVAKTRPGSRSHNRQHHAGIARAA